MFRGDGNALMAVSGDVSASAAVVGSLRLKPLPQRRCATSLTCRPSIDGSPRPERRLDSLVTPRRQGR